ncbi:hypothetical protein SEA_MAGRITTE_77 [Microbacterium phage Magritte]|nr:hypothetical protein SEA_MAGRITTE_77 [Microbacterium phage Magritte]
MSFPTRIDRSMEHVDLAVKNEGKILTAADKALLPLTDTQRVPVLEEMTIKEARETNERINREIKRLDSMKHGLIDARSHLVRIVGKSDD